MNRSIRTKIALAALAFGALGAAGAADAASVYITAGSPAPVYVQAPPRVYVAPPVRIAQRGWDERYEHARRWEHACRAARWDPQARYMPGDAVWRRGTLYVATDVSASVWNVNSPPEWTPNYWVPASCR